MSEYALIGLICQYGEQIAKKGGCFHDCPGYLILFVLPTTVQWLAVFRIED
jgi:hypothetical protein